MPRRTVAASGPGDLEQHRAVGRIDGEKSAVALVADSVRKCAVDSDRAAQHHLMRCQTGDRCGPERAVGWHCGGGRLRRRSRDDLRYVLRIASTRLWCRRAVALPSGAPAVAFPAAVAAAIVSAADGAAVPAAAARVGGGYLP